MASETFEWVERLGGWAVAIGVLFWMTRQHTRLINGFHKAIEDFTKAIITFRSFEVEARQGHAQTMERLADIISSVDRLHDKSAKTG
jgi:hypothetical protein